MPFIGIKCPDPAMSPVMEPHACFKCALSRVSRACNYPAWLIEQTVPGFKPDEEAVVWDEDRESYSPSSMEACGRSLFLKRTVPYTLSPGDVWVMVRGTVTHAFIEHSTPVPGVIRELRGSRTLMVDGEEAEIRFRVDELYPEIGHVVDTKTVSFITRTMRERATPRWTAQLSVYRWGLAPEYTVRTAEVVHLDAREPYRRQYRLWTAERTEEYIARRVRELRSIYRDGYLPPVLEEEDQWKCERCPVLAQCIEAAITDGEAPPDIEGRKERAKARRGRAGKR